MGLRRELAHMAGQIPTGESALGKQHQELATFGAVLNMFELDADPEPSPSIRPITQFMFSRYGDILSFVCYGRWRSRTSFYRSPIAPWERRGHQTNVRRSFASRSTTAVPMPLGAPVTMARQLRCFRWL